MPHFEPVPGWETIVPIYRARRAVRPATKARYRAERPFTTMDDNDSWQYGERSIAAGEIVETKAWPHPSFDPLNYSAQKTLAFFNGALRSRLPVSPWHGGQVRLDNGLSDAPMKFDIRPPQIRGMDMSGSSL
jgi:hypothetical protein